MTIDAYGIDISNHQTLDDAQAVWDNGIRFAYCKASEGLGYTDVDFDDFVPALDATSIVCGAYHFARSGSATEQARFFHGIAARYLEPEHLWPCLDMEDGSMAGYADAFICEFYDALGAGCMVVYANQNWCENYLHPDRWGGRNLLLWIASYTGAPGQPNWSSNITALHQHTSKGNVPGLPGYIDRDCTMPGWTLAQVTVGAPAPALPPEDDMGLNTAWVIDAEKGRAYCSFETGSNSAVVHNVWIAAKALWGDIPAVRVCFTGDDGSMIEPEYASGGPDLASNKRAFWKAPSGASDVTLEWDPAKATGVLSPYLVSN